MKTEFELDHGLHERAVIKIIGEAPQHALLLPIREEPKSKKLKLYYTKEGQLLYSRNWPEVPEVKASIYQDTAAMNRFNMDMEVLLRHPVHVSNFEETLTEIVWQCGRINRGNFYELSNDFKIHSNESSYTCEVYPIKKEANKEETNKEDQPAKPERSKIIELSNIVKEILNTVRHNMHHSDSNRLYERLEKLKE
jgi:hypothetical protein